MQILLLVFSLVPSVLKAIMALEVVFPLPSAGKAKLDLILGIVNDVYAATPSLTKEIPSTQLTSMLTTVISRIVSTLNVLGVFKSGVVTPPVSVPAP